MTDPLSSHTTTTTNIPVVVWDYTNNIFYALGEKHSKKRVFTEGKRQRIEKKIPFLSFRIYLYFIGVSNRHLTSAEKQINKMGGIDVCVSSVATVGFNYNNPLFASYCTQPKCCSTAHNQVK